MGTKAFASIFKQAQADNSAEMAALQAEKEQALAEKRAKQEELTAQEKAKARKARGLATLMGTSSTTGTIYESLG